MTVVAQTPSNNMLDFFFKAVGEVLILPPTFIRIQLLSLYVFVVRSVSIFRHDMFMFRICLSFLSIVVDIWPGEVPGRVPGEGQMTSI